MTSRKIILFVLLVVFVIQARIAVGNPVHRDNLQLLLTQALKVGDCARIIPVTEPLPLRFRRTPNKKKFQCIITLS